MRKVFLLSLFHLFFVSALTAQTANLAIGKVSSVCADQEVFIPVTVSNLNNAGAISLNIGFDPLQLTFVNLTNIHPQLSGLVFNAITSPPQIKITWSNVVPVNIVDGKLFDLQLLFAGTTAPLVFNTGCELTNEGLNPITTNYVDGEVISGVPEILNNPSNCSVHQGGTALFNVTSSDASAFQWKESENQGLTWKPLEETEHYSGTQTPVLRILNVPLMSDQYLYLCTVLKGNCSTNSQQAKLTVDSMTGIPHLSNGILELKQNYPNPVVGLTHFDYFLEQPGHIKLQIFNYLGLKILELTDSFQGPGNYSLEYDFSSFPAGIYYYQLESLNHSQRSLVVKKLVKSD